jgi:hypothetical protein
MNPTTDVPAVPGHSRIGPAREAGRRPDPPSISASMQQVSELETENQRLQRLVAELLLKNQQLRAELKALAG